MKKNNQRLLARGTILYAPERENFRKTHKEKTLIVQLKRDDLCRYYRWFLKAKHGMSLDIQPPMYGAHVTIVRGDERVRDEKLIRSYNGMHVAIEYSTEMFRAWKFWCLPVHPSGLQEIRNRLGLRAPNDFHITIGRQYDWQ